MIRSRIFAISCGYEDTNDLDRLRSDPAFKLACGRLLSLKGAIVTADALNCQRAIAGQIVDQGGDYAFALKGNHQALHADVSLFFDDKDFTPASVHTPTDGDHGRIEPRISAVSKDIAGFRNAIAGRGSPLSAR